MEHFSGDTLVKRMKEIKAQLGKATSDEAGVEQHESLLEELLIIVEDIDCAKGAEPPANQPMHAMHFVGSIASLAEQAGTFEHAAYQQAMNELFFYEMSLT